jgi:Tfp pilus assembly protein PilV
MQNRIHHQLPLMAKKRTRGIALLESLLALGIVSGGILASLAFNANVTGYSANNRVSSLALIAAQARLEELRQLPFDDLEDLLPGSRTVTQDSPAFSSNGSVSVTVCWTTSLVTSGGITVNNIRRVAVAAVGGGRNCDAATDGAPGRLETLIARSDARFTANQSAQGRKADGDATLVSDFPKPTGTPELIPGGFQIVRNPEGVITAVYNPSTGQALENTGGLLFATISGNIILDNKRILEAQFTVPEPDPIDSPLPSRERYRFERLLVGAEGNAFCRTYYPGSEVGANETPPDPPKLARNDLGVLVEDTGPNGISVIQYTCVVPNEWRRTILLATRNTNEKVCVGVPTLQPEDETDDLLRSPGRLYTGRGRVPDPDDAESGLVVRTGMRGSSILEFADGATEVLAPLSGSFGYAASIGSVCKEGQPCYLDDGDVGLVRDWIPGGHHYFVMDNRDGLCADRMDEVFLSLDRTDPEDFTTRVAYYGNFLFRNPQIVYCTNQKEYTARLGSFAPGAEFSSVDCLSSTAFSGFLTPGSGVTNDLVGNQVFFSSSSRFATPCVVAGPLGTRASAYSCGFPDRFGVNEDPDDPGPFEGLELILRVQQAALTFAPSQATLFRSFKVPHDVVNQSFIFTDDTTGGGGGGGGGSGGGGDPVTTCSVPISWTGTAPSNIEAISGADSSGTAANCTVPNNNKKSFTCSYSGVEVGETLTLQVTVKNKGANVVLSDTYSVPATCDNRSTIF